MGPKPVTKDDYMYFIGIDVSRKTFHFHVADESGRRVTAAKRDNHPKEFRELVKPYAVSGVKVAIEVGNICFAASRAMRDEGAEVVVVNTYRNFLIRESMQKTDRLDAKQLCEQLRLGQLPKHPVFIPPPEAEVLRHMMQSRAKLVSKRTALSNEVTRIADQNGVYLAKSALNRKAGWDALRLQASAWEENARALIELRFRIFLCVQTELEAIEWRIIEHLEKNFQEDLRLLETIYGLGQITAATFLAYVVDVNRFESARELCRYVGLAPLVRESGNHREPGRITKQGNPLLRSYLTQVAIHVRRLPPEAPLRQWYEALVKRRGWRKARIALARKITSIAYGVLKHRRPFDPRLAR